MAFLLSSKSIKIAIKHIEKGYGHKQKKQEHISELMYLALIGSVYAFSLRAFRNEVNKKRKNWLKQPSVLSHYINRLLL